MLRCPWKIALNQSMTFHKVLPGQWKSIKIVGGDNKRTAKALISVHGSRGGSAFSLYVAPEKKIFRF